MNAQWQLIQQWAGVAADGIPGPATAAAIIARAGLAPAPAKHALAHPAAFFQAVRGITKTLDQQQVDSINAIMADAAHWPVGWLAYGLATAWHEARFIPQREWGRGAGKPYGKPGKYGQAQYGRGFVQLTWDANYERADKEIGLGGKLLQNFDLALQPDIASAILVGGMEGGWFTEKKLADYIGARGTRAAFTAARRIVNGTDKASLIAGYAEKFQAALDAGGWA